MGQISYHELRLGRLVSGACAECIHHPVLQNVSCQRKGDFSFPSFRHDKPAFPIQSFVVLKKAVPPIFPPPSLTAQLPIVDMLPSFTMFSAAALASFLSLVSAAPLEKRAPSGPVISSNFPDPSIIKVGGTWYSFGTNLGDSTVPHVQIATSTDFKTWTLTGDDALPNLPAWVATGTPAVWAPDVIQNDNGNFVMYFSAARAANAARHCVGVATSDTITGPYTAQSTAWVCHNDQGGSIDASSFVDSDGSRYVTYKIDVSLSFFQMSFESTDVIIGKLSRQWRRLQQ